MKSLQAEFQECLERLKEDGLQPGEWNILVNAINAIKKSRTERMHFFGQFLGIEFSDGKSARMRLGPQHINTFGVTQGGALYSFADIVMGYEILKDLPPDDKVVTQELKMNFVRPGRGDWLFCRPVIVHRGKRTVIMQAEISNDQDQTVAVALGTFCILKDQ